MNEWWSLTNLVTLISSLMFLAFQSPWTDSGYLGLLLAVEWSCRLQDCVGSNSKSSKCDVNAKVWILLKGRKQFRNSNHRKNSSAAIITTLLCRNIHLSRLNSHFLGTIVLKSTCSSEFLLSSLVSLGKFTFNEVPSTQEQIVSIYLIKISYWQ